jgi:hypothetical protein
VNGGFAQPTAHAAANVIELLVEVFVVAHFEITFRHEKPRFRAGAAAGKCPSRTSAPIWLFSPACRPTFFPSPSLQSTRSPRQFEIASRATIPPQLDAPRPPRCAEG